MLSKEWHKSGTTQSEKYLNIKFALKSTWKTLKDLEKVLEFYHLQEDSTMCLEYKIIVPLIGAAYAAPNKGTTVLY